MAGGRGEDDEGFGPVLRGEREGVERELRGEREGVEREDAKGEPGGPGTSGDDRGYGPAASGRGRAWLPRLPALPRPGRGLSAGRTLRTLVVLLLVPALLVMGTGVALAVYASVRMDRVEVDGLSPTPGGRMNVLVVGSDSREGLTPEELLALGTESVEGQRTDSIFVLSVEGGAAALLSFPRDLYVSRCDGSQGRVNGAYASGGPSCLVQTVASESGIPITHYLEVNLAGLARMVEALGGVELFLDAPLVDVAAGVDLPAGCVTLDGLEALGFVRARSVDSDLGRIARQQRFLKELAQDAASPGTLVNLPRLFRVAGAAGSALTADTGLGLIDLARLARAGRGLASGGLATYTVPTVPQRIGGADVLVATQGADAVFSRFADGSILEVPPVPEVGLQPGDVEVAVLNGATREGLAAQGRDYLAARGFRVGEVGNTAPASRTVVRHAPGMEPAALLVAAQLADVGTELSAAGGPDLALVLGEDANLSAPPPPPPPPPAEADAGGVPAAVPDAVGAGVVPADC